MFQCNASKRHPFNVCKIIEAMIQTLSLFNNTTKLSVYPLIGGEFKKLQSFTICFMEVIEKHKQYNNIKNWHQGKGDDIAEITKERI